VHAAHVISLVDAPASPPSLPLFTVLPASRFGSISLDPNGVEAFR
jgi:hypothetical protein